MNQGGSESPPQPKADPAASNRALKAFIWAVVALVLFNIVLFAKFVIGAKSGDAANLPTAQKTNAQGPPATPR